MTPQERWLVDRAAREPGRTAIIDSSGRYTYADLSAASAGIAGGLLKGETDLAEARVAFLEPPGFRYAAAQWGIWRAGGIAVPLAPSHPAAELGYVLEDAGATIVIAHPSLRSRLEPLAQTQSLRLVTTVEPADAILPAIDPSRRAMMLYTSGTTGKPKGVITTHANLRAQITTLVDAWEWRADDRILHVLPLHHVHGIVNALSCALWAGACCEFVREFDPAPVWDRLASGEITLFMAVPTIYGRLIAAWDAADPETRRRWSAGTAPLRLMVSGSAALPVGTLNRWRAITGHTLLERYGMTEIGMALSNPLEGERRAGTVGRPLPGVAVRLTDVLGVVEPGTAGQIEVRGDQVFSEYWNRPEATVGAFRDGWFMTGDVGVVEGGYYRILGRESVDIIKSAGYKISALEIEEALREHPDIRDCAVVGLADDDLGERVAVAIVAGDGADLAAAHLRAWAKERLAPYKIPRTIVFVAALPRNAMGKVTKADVRALIAARA
ncbi:MAG: acyl-CoA synthetase [Gemmatimonadota bacterium]